MGLMSDSNKCMYVFLGVDSVNSLPLVNQVTTSPGEHFSATVFVASWVLRGGFLRSVLELSTSSTLPNEAAVNDLHDMSHVVHRLISCHIAQSAVKRITFTAILIWCVKRDASLTDVSHTRQRVSHSKLLFSFDSNDEKLFLLATPKMTE